VLARQTSGTNVSLPCLEALGVEGQNRYRSSYLLYPFSELASISTTLGTPATRIHTRIQVSSLLHDTGGLLILTVIDDV
jgi:hypothetical protein